MLPPSSTSTILRPKRLERRPREDACHFARRMSSAIGAGLLKGRFDLSIRVEQHDDEDDDEQTDTAPRSARSGSYTIVVRATKDDHDSRVRRSASAPSVLFSLPCRGNFASIRKSGSVTCG